MDALPVDPLLIPPARRILALGDSYTIGEAVIPEQRWPVQLAERLRGCGLRIMETEIIARTGWTTDELLAGLALSSPAGPYDLVTLLIGVNNQYRRRPLAEYCLQFTDLLARAINLSGGTAGRVLVLSIPDWGITPVGQASGRATISDEINAFNAANRAVAEHCQTRYVDIAPISRRAWNNSALLAEDGLHPSGQMYTAWVDAMLADGIAALKC